MLDGRSYCGDAKGQSWGKHARAKGLSECVEHYQEQDFFPVSSYNCSEERVDFVQHGYLLWERGAYLLGKAVATTDFTFDASTSIQNSFKFIFQPSEKKHVVYTEENSNDYCCPYGG